jgi:hypothetical protein
MELKKKRRTCYLLKTGGKVVLGIKWPRTCLHSIHALVFCEVEFMGNGTENTAKAIFFIL